MPEPVEVEPDFFVPKRGRPKSSVLHCLLETDKAWKFVKGVDFNGSEENFRARVRQWSVDNDKHVLVKISEDGNVVIAQASELTDEQRRVRKEIGDKVRKRFAARKLRESRLERQAQENSQ